MAGPRKQLSPKALDAVEEIIRSGITQAEMAKAISKRFRCSKRAATDAIIEMRQSRGGSSSAPKPRPAPQAEVMSASDLEICRQSLNARRDALTLAGEQVAKEMAEDAAEGRKINMELARYATNLAREMAGVSREYRQLEKHCESRAAAMTAEETDDLMYSWVLQLPPGRRTALLRRLDEGKDQGKGLLA